MTLHNGVDAAFPGGQLPAGTSILAAYVGGEFQPGAPDTPHIWTASEWNHYLDVDPNLRLLPIYTHNFPGDPVADANNAVDAVRALGWAPNMPGDLRRIIAVDLEVFVDPPYVSALGTEIGNRGFAMMPYGSNGEVKGNPPGIGYWVADLVMTAQKTLGTGVQGVQYRFGQQWDYNVFSQRVYDGCGVGRRRG
jgi:hypothetical protein